MEPLTVNDPDDTEYSNNLPIVYVYVPFVNKKEYDDSVIAPELSPLLKLTYQFVPEK